MERVDYGWIELMGWMEGSAKIEVEKVFTKVGLMH